MTRIEENIESCTQFIEEKGKLNIASVNLVREAFRCMRELEVQIQALTKRIEELEKK